VFMVLLPTGVGYWWYNSIKFSADQVLMDTTHLYFSLLHKTPNMISRRAIAVLSGAFEFWKVYNKDVIERPSDDREVPLLLKDLPKDNVKERPLCFPYSIKTRAILLAHLNRIPLPPDTLDADRAFILHKVPLLIQEMVQIFSQLVVFASAGRINRTPMIDTLENIVRLLPQFVQASWDTRSALLQLPHFQEDMLRHCITKKRRIRTCQDLASMPSADRRMLLRNLSDAQYTLDPD
jgi:translocation protein SEC63